MKTASHADHRKSTSPVVRAITRVILRRAGWIALIGNILGILGFIYTVQLYKNLRTNIEELLPTNARSVTSLAEVTRRLQSIDSLAVLVFSKDPAASRRFVEDLAAKMKLVPKTVVSYVEYRIDQELKFFRQRQALFMELPDLIRVRNYIKDRIDYERELYNPLNIFRSDEIPEPRLNFGDIRQKYLRSVAGYDRYPEGYYATSDETKRVLLVYASDSSSNIGQAIALKSSVENAIRELKPSSYAKDLSIGYANGIEDSIEEHAALIADLELSTVVVVLLVTLAMLVFFGDLRSTIALTGSLFMGTFWTFGLSYFIVGYLNANSAFLGSIVIGNGINFGIIFLARYLEARRDRRGNSRAMYLAVAHTARPTWTAALAAGLSYGSLMLTGFRGFNQFGVIGLIGMVLCWISAYTLMPAYLTLWDRMAATRFTTTPRRRLSLRSRFAPAAWAASCVARYPAIIWGLSLVLTAASLATFTRFSPGRILETNLSKLRNKDSMEHGSLYQSRFVDEIFQRYLSPMVILPQSHEEAVRISQRLKEKKEKDGAGSPIDSVQILDDFLPKQQAEKIAILRQIRGLLPPRMVQRLSPSDQKLVGDFLTEAVMSPLTDKQLPPLLLSKFQEKNGKIGNLVLVSPTLDSYLWPGEKLIRFVHELRETADSVVPGTPVAGSLTITSDMIEAISVDGPKATLFAFLAVVVLVVLLFRDLATISQILFALALGVLWLAGMILGFGLKINFLNFIALPITFGIGVDYGVNIFERYRQEGGGNILRVIRNTGGAVALCSFTTIIGYTSLLIAGNQGFVSFGRLAVAGELTCVVAAVISLPAYLLLRHRRGTSPENPVSGFKAQQV